MPLSISLIALLLITFLTIADATPPPSTILDADKPEGTGNRFWDGYAHVKIKVPALSVTLHGDRPATSAGLWTGRVHVNIRSPWNDWAYALLRGGSTPVYFMGS
ncbi:hypothetical protein BC628DRAFT_1337757 [Trametes gibbosa]|nr:hypothetical protein BC628DRAFT_1337757 [Trametes gibbosa]